jgi:hypothetical protein
VVQCYQVDEPSIRGKDVALFELAQGGEEVSGRISVNTVMNFVAL